MRRLLHYVGVVRRPLTEQPPQECRVLHRVPARDHIYADSSERGLFEPLIGLGEEVTAGQTGGLIHLTTTPWREPEPVTAKVGGVVLCRLIPARAGRGDCVFVIGRDWNSPSSTAVSDR
ncbi:hypothetical protein GOA97_31680 [Sinorhizobium meliloti]|nr:hypothetical protein [Sinorhizobium meliloti]MDW9658884.1 hypothetical protein [Sinorhizobium meliloti]MDW9881689.1 hypothetical protein [Sinorhizobium meliloti]MDW9918845.1 hypothetical protein [Sinorhizobium meliloti]MDW9949943.1 hypothetical protein [Sinorhizobium meliloti]